MASFCTIVVLFLVIVADILIVGVETDLPSVYIWFELYKSLYLRNGVWH